MEIKYNIRNVKKSDLDQLFILLNELVIHEGLENRFKLTKTRLEEELFVKDWNCIVAIDLDDKLIGFCLYSFANINRAFNLTPMIQIDDLYVSENFRKAGIGHKLLQELTNIARGKNISRINVWCIKDNEQGQKFYQKIGCQKLDFIDVYTLYIDN